jgi:recombinational DNA repair ATPase RecF
MGVLWLKLSELQFIESRLGERPVLLLDDVFSELDDEHDQLVMGLLGKQQTIITSTDTDGRFEGISDLSVNQLTLRPVSGQVG